MSTWGVVTMVKEPPELLAVFASYYVSLGAQEINIFLDGDDPEARRLLAQIPNCRVEVMDEAFFQSNWGMSYPANSFKRQRLIATKAYREAVVDWMLFLDADEYLQNNNFSQELSEVPPHVDTVSIPNGERVFYRDDAAPTLFGGLMLQPKQISRRKAMRLFGEERLKYSDNGFCAHRFGKSATRTGKPYNLGVHAPQKWRGNIEQIVSDASIICHYDGLTEIHWMIKLLRYLDAVNTKARKKNNKFRAAQIRYLTDSDSDKSVFDLHNIIRKYDKESEQNLRRNVLIGDISADPLQGLDVYYDKAEFDISVDWFDGCIKKAMPDLFARLPDAVLRKAAAS